MGVKLILRSLFGVQRIGDMPARMSQLRCFGYYYAYAVVWGRWYSQFVCDREWEKTWNWCKVILCL